MNSDSNMQTFPFFNNIIILLCFFDSTKNVVWVLPTDGDGLNEMIIGYTDRVVRSYRWSADPTSAGSTDSQNCWCGRFVLVESWVLAGQVRCKNCLTVDRIRDKISRIE